MGRLAICRHGCTRLNGSEGSPEIIRGWLDAGLNATGVSEAVELARRLDKNYKLRHVYCSDLPRTRETAEIIADHCSAAIIPEPRLRTWHLLGYEGKPVAECIDELRELEANPEHRPRLGGESLLEFLGRVHGCLNDILHDVKKSKYDAVMVTHGRVISCVEPALRGELRPTAYAQYSKTGALLELKPRGKAGWKLFDLG